MGPFDCRDTKYDATRSDSRSFPIRMDSLHLIEKGSSRVSLKQIFGVKLSLLVSVKYLEVILDSPLTWREHMDVKVRKAHNLLWACRRAWGTSSESETQSGPRVLCRHHSADRLLCILCMVVWLSNS